MMRSDLKLELSSRARSDISAILQYTLTEWGAEQRNGYAQAIQRALNRILAFPEMGEVVQGAPNLRVMPVSEHIVVYRLRRTSIFVVRVLHRKMHFEDHLS